MCYLDRTFLMLLTPIWETLDTHRNCLYYSYMKKPVPRRLGRTSAIATDQVMYSLMHAAGAIERRLEDALAQVDLSMPKFGALTHLVQAGEPISLSECA